MSAYMNSSRVSTTSNSGNQQLLQQEREEDEQQSRDSYYANLNAQNSISSQHARSTTNAQQNSKRESLRRKGLCSRVFFGWIKPLLKRAQTEKIRLQDLGEIDAQDKTERQQERLERAWKHYIVEAATKEDSLYWAVFRAFRREFFIAVFWNIIVAALQLSTPFLLRKLIAFIQGVDPKSDSTGHGLALAGSLVGVQFLAYFINEHLTFYTKMTGCKSTNAMKALIFNKTLKINDVTNKNFSEQRIASFIQVDAVKLQFLATQGPMVARLPFVILVCFILLFDYLGWSFLAAFLVFFATFFVNMGLERKNGKVQRTFMERQDARVQALSECVKNIRTIKLNAWEQIFTSQISEARQLEIEVLRQKFRLSRWTISSLYFFPQILTITVFSFYVGFGHNLALDVAFAIIAILNIIKDPLIAVPLFTGQLYEFKGHMKKLQEFLLVDEINRTLITKELKAVTPNSIQIKEQSNFHYGAKTSRKRQAKVEELQQMLGTSNSAGSGYRLRRNSSFSTLYASEPLLVDKKRRDSHLSRDYKTIEDFLMLKGLQFEVVQGEFVMIVGRIGSGKSSLIRTILGELMYVDPQYFKENCARPFEELDKIELLQLAKESLPKFKSPVVHSENFSFVQQEPWILSESIAANITFGKAFSKEMFDEVVKICELEQDLQHLPEREETILGDQGIQMTHEQQIKISLARALYSSREALIVDDILGQLDSQLRNRIVKKVFLRKLRQQTRVLVTNCLEFVNLADKVVVIKDGKVAVSGPYSVICDHEDFVEVVQDWRSQQKVAEQTSMRNSLRQQQSFENISQEDPSKMEQDELVDIDDVASEMSSTEEAKPIISEIQGIQADELDLGGKTNGSHTSEGLVVARSNSLGITETDERLTKIKGLKSRSVFVLEDASDDVEIYSGPVFKRYLQFVGGYSTAFGATFFVVIFSCFKVASDLMIGFWAVTSDQHTKFGLYCGLTFLFAVLASVMVFVRIQFMQRKSLEGTTYLHDEMLESVIKSSVAKFFNFVPANIVQNRFSRDLSIVETMFIFILGTWQNSFAMLFTVLLLAALSIPLVLLYAPIPIVLIVWLYKRQRQGSKQMQSLAVAYQRPQLRFLRDTLLGGQTIRAFNKGDFFVAENYKLLNDVFLVSQWSEGIPLWFALRVDFVSISIFGAISILAVLQRNQIYHVPIALLLSYSLTIQGVITTALRCQMQVQSRIRNVDRCLKVLNIPQEKTMGMIQKDQFARENPSWPSDGHITFQDVEFKIEEEGTGERHMGPYFFQIMGSQKVAILGPKGSGRSTLSLSLSRFVELNHGTVTVDGFDLSEIHTGHLRKKITVIPRQPVIFKGTLRFNLDPTKTNSDATIIQLLDSLDLTHLLQIGDEKLKQGGLDLQLGPFSSTLNLEEQLWICMARAILRQNRIVIYEEPSDALSDSFRSKMQQAMNDHFDESTMLVIPSARATVLHCDKVLLLNEKSESVAIQVPTDLKNGPGAVLAEQLMSEMDSRMIKQASASTF